MCLCVASHTNKRRWGREGVGGEGENEGVGGGRSIVGAVSWHVRKGKKMNRKCKKEVKGKITNPKSLEEDSGLTDGALEPRLPEHSFTSSRSPVRLHSALFLSLSGPLTRSLSLTRTLTLFGLFG